MPYPDYDPEFHGARKLVLCVEKDWKPLEFVTLSMILHQKILAHFELWRPELLTLPKNIIALNIGIQNLDNGTFEIYLDGYDWYEMTNDVWLLGKEWSPTLNYLSIDKAEHPILTQEMVAEVKKSFHFASESGLFKVPKHVELITLHAGGLPETLFYRQAK